MQRPPVPPSRGMSGTAGPGGVGGFNATGGSGTGVMGMGGMGGMTGGGFRPGTGQVAGLGGTGRPPVGSSWGGRPGSSLRGPAALGEGPLGVTAAADVRVAERPVTQQGVRGMKSAHRGPGRQIFDRTYYLTLLRQKNQELSAEIQTFRKEIDTIQKEAQLALQYEKRYDQLIKLVRSLEGDLADFNLALDKRRTDTRLEEVLHMYRVLKASNEQQRLELDSIFLEKKQHEEEVERIEEEIAEVRKVSEERLGELHPEQRAEYSSLQEENRALMQDIVQLRQELEDTNSALSSMEGRLRADASRMKAQHLRESLEELEKRKAEVDRAASQRKLTVPEQRELLMQKVKEDNAAILAAERDLETERNEVEKLQRGLAEVQADVEDTKGGGKLQKYQVLFSKDEEMTEFIKNFDDRKEQEESAISEKQKSVVSLLESISKQAKRENNLPTFEKVADVRDEIDFKNQQLENSKLTHERLQGELEKRTSELRRIADIDEKINVELSTLGKKIEVMKDELANKFSSTDELRAAAAEEQTALERRRDLLTARAPAVKRHMEEAKLQADSKAQQLADDQTHQHLEELETKLRQFEQNIFHLKSFVEQKGREADCTAQLKAVTGVTEQVNALLIRSLNQPPGSAGTMGMGGGGIGGIGPGSFHGSGMGMSVLGK